MTTETYLVLRHGSNAANQSMTQTLPVCFIEAPDYAEAKTLAYKKVEVFNNQHLEITAELHVDTDDWNNAVEMDLPTYKRATEKLRPQEAVAV